MGETQQCAVVIDEGRAVENLKAFLARFERFKQEEIHALKPIRDFIARFAAARDGLNQQVQEWEAAVAPRFNVFQALRIERRETKLHSRFLAELLDPKGCHGQHDHFLKLFLSCDPALYPLKPWPGPSGWEISTEEQATRDNRLDIVLRCRRCKFITVIENKVDACEQETQLKRYTEVLDREKTLTRQNLIFLTPNGRSPKTGSLKRCVCLSYQEHIRKWLEASLEQIQPPSLRSSLEQYLRVVKSL